MSKNANLALSHTRDSGARSFESEEENAYAGINQEGFSDRRFRLQSGSGYRSRARVIYILKSLIRVSLGCILGFSLAGVSLFDSLLPLGPAYAGVWIGSGLPGGFLLVLSTVLGLMQKISGIEFIARIGSYLFMFFLIIMIKRKSALPSYGMVLLFFVGLVGYWRILGLSGRPFLLLVVELGFSVFFYLALKPGLFRLFSKNIDYKAKGLRYSLGIISVLIYSALPGIFASIFGEWFNVSFFYALFVLSILTMYCGIGVGSAMAAAFVLGDVVTGRFVPWGMMLLTGTGLFGGFGKEIKWQKLGYTLGFLGNLILVFLVWKEARLEQVIFSSILALSTFLLIPKSAGRKSSHALLAMEEYGLFGEKAENVKTVLFKRLHGISDLFSEMSKVFKDDSTGNERKSTLNLMIGEITEECCAECGLSKKCWEELFYTTYREVFDLITVADMYGIVRKEHFRGRLGKECIQQEQLLSVINHKTERHKVEYLWKKRYDEAKSFLSTQLRGMSGIIMRLTQQINLDLGYQTEIEKGLFTALTRMGFFVHDLSVTCFSRHNIEVNITKKSCGSKEECRSIVAPLVAQLLDGGFSVQRRQCKLGDSGDCRFSLSTSKCFTVRSATGAIPKDGNELCGDSHRLIVSDDGYTAAILSDGMGVGEKAAKQSKMTISLMERLMATGLDKKVSLQLVNSLLLLRSSEENFATLDLFVLDHYTGEGEFIKIGSAPTYFKRDQDVNVIRSTSLPVGIINDVEPEYFRYSLQNKDYIIMVTDGFLGFEDDKDGDWILRALKKADDLGPDSLCRYLMELARIKSGNSINDDMSIIVLQIVNEDNFVKSRNSFL